MAEFDVRALMAAIDLIERGGMPDQAEQLRELVRYAGRCHAALKEQREAFRRIHESRDTDFILVANRPGSGASVRGAGIHAPTMAGPATRTEGDAS